MPLAEGTDVVFLELVHHILGENFKFAANILFIPSASGAERHVPNGTLPPITTRGYPLLFLVGQV